MDDKTSRLMDNVCTMLGGALLLFPLIKQATDTLAPEMKKLTSSEYVEELKMLPMGEDNDSDKQEKQEQHKRGEQKSHDDEVSELKRKLAEYEKKPDREHEKQDHSEREDRPAQKEQPSQQEHESRQEYDKRDC